MGKAHTDAVDRVAPGNWTQESDEAKPHVLIIFSKCQRVCEE